MVVIGVFVFGLISYEQLSVNLMPDISYPSLTVRTEYTGTAPEEIETTISRPVEQALGVVDNLVSISSISKAGQSDVKLEFTWNSDMNKATADVREMLDQVFFPEDAERPLILRYDPTLDPIMRLGLYGEASLFYLRYLSDEEIKRILETVDGVAAVKVKGGLEEEILVELNEQKLALIGINIQQVKNRLAQENVNLAGGNLKEGQTEYLVRTLNEFKTVGEISEVVVGNWGGREIKVRDIAKVHRTNKDREIITRINGRESVEIQIFKEADANIVAVAERVKRRVFGTPEQQAFVKRLQAEKEKKTDGGKKAEPTNGKATNGKARAQQDLRARMMTNFVAYNLPDGVEISTLSDQSIFIQNAVDEVKSTAMLGGALAILVLFVFLRNIKSTVVVGISIPVSIVATFAAMRLFDVSLNIMSLGGLALGIGMLVDNSIVVLESIARCRDEGDSLVQATVRGVSEVGSAVFASTLTTVAVFFPIVFVEGIAGQIFGDMALTVVFSLLASLAVALFLIPMLASRDSSQFIGGIQKSELLKNQILSFSTETEIDDLVSGNVFENVGQKSFTGIRLAAQALLQAGWKILEALAVLALAVIKHLALFGGLFFVPIFGLLRLARVVKFKLGDRLVEFAQSPDIGKLAFADKIWPAYWVSRSLSTLFDDMRRYFTRIKERGVIGKIVLGLLLPLYVVFYLIKYVLFVLFELGFRLAHFLLISAAALVKMLVLETRVLLAFPIKALFAGYNWGYGKIEAGYPRLLIYSLEHKTMVLGSVGVAFLFSIFIVAPRLGSELIPEVHQGEFNVDVIMPVGTPVERTDRRTLDIQDFLMQQPAVVKVASVAGTDKTASTQSEEGEHTAKLTVTLKRASSVVQEEESVIATIRREMGQFPGINWKISRPVLFSFKTPIEVEIHGYNLLKLQRIANEVEGEIAGIPGVFDVESNMQRGNPEVQIVYNRVLLSKYGLNILDVASIVRNKVRGDVASEFKEKDRKIDILVRLRESDRQSIEDLRRLIINPGASTPIPLQAVADIRVNEGPAEIRRVDQQRTAVITANISGRDLSSVNEDIYQVLRATRMPDDFTFTLAGQNKEMQTSLDSLKLALALAIFLVYIVMASQFESLIHPFVIIFTIPLALIGVILFLYIFNIPLSIVVFLGLIMLAGIVVNNAIVLVDYINQLRARGLKKVDAIVQAGNVRLRPILMTTATTVLGLLPMALGLGDGAEIRTPMAITVIIGIITSTLLTLVVIPTVYSLVDRGE